MLHIADKHNCCGCSACSQICGKQAITMTRDEEGFLYPITDLEKCVDCGLCEKVCPFINPYDKLNPIKIEAFKCSDLKIRMKSTSGGAFSVIAESVLNEGGVVFGARFDDNWQVVIDHVESVDELYKFRGTKYVQASMGQEFTNCKKYLRENRIVLFTGTPCQIAGLKHFLGREYDRLITVEIICHGTPSPKVWNAYLQSISGNISKISEINFRYKNGNGGNRYLIKNRNQVFFDGPAANSTFCQGFQRHFYLRPSCHSCKAKEARSHADITLGDCWGIANINPDFFDKNGVSAVFFNTKKSMRFFNLIESVGDIFSLSIDFMLKYNPSYACSSSESDIRSYFWKTFEQRGIVSLNKSIKKDKFILRKILNKLKHII